MSAISPTKNTGLIVDDFIAYATQHLTTVGGTVTTTSLYPPAGTPAPGVLTWTGYFVDPSTPSQPSVEEVSEILEEEELEALAIQRELVQEDINTVESVIEETEEEEVRTVGKRFISTAINDRLPIGEAIVTNNPVKEEDKNNRNRQNEEDERRNPPGGGGSGNKKYNKNKNLDLIERALAKVGITDVAIVKAVKANAIKESGGQPIVEFMNYGSTSNERIRSIFGKRASKYTDAQLNSIKSNPQSMGDLMYGPDAGNVGKWLGNTSAGDGFKYRGRGFIQITGKANYTANSLAVYKNTSLVTNPDLLLQPEPAADSCAWFINRSLKTFSKKMGIPTTGASQSDANLLITSIIAGSPIKRGSGSYLASLVTKVDVYSTQV